MESGVPKGIEGQPMRVPFSIYNQKQARTKKQEDKRMKANS